MDKQHLLEYLEQARELLELCEQKIFIPKDERPYDKSKQIHSQNREDFEEQRRSISSILSYLEYNIKDGELENTTITYRIQSDDDQYQYECFNIDLGYQDIDCIEKQDNKVSINIDQIRDISNKLSAEIYTVPFTFNYKFLSIYLKLYMETNSTTKELFEVPLDQKKVIYLPLITAISKEKNYKIAYNNNFLEISIPGASPQKVIQYLDKLNKVDSTLKAEFNKDTNTIKFDCKKLTDGSYELAQEMDYVISGYKLLDKLTSITDIDYKKFIEIHENLKKLYNWPDTKLNDGLVEEFSQATYIKILDKTGIVHLPGVCKAIALEYQRISLLKKPINIIHKLVNNLNKASAFKALYISFSQLIHANSHKRNSDVFVSLYNGGIGFKNKLPKSPNYFTDPNKAISKFSEILAIFKNNSDLHTHVIPIGIKRSSSGHAISLKFIKDEDNIIIELFDPNLGIYRLENCEQAFLLINNIKDLLKYGPVTERDTFDLSGSFSLTYAQFLRLTFNNFKPFIKRIISEFKDFSNTKFLAKLNYFLLENPEYFENLDEIINNIKDIKTDLNNIDLYSIVRDCRNEESKNYPKLSTFNWMVAGIVGMEQLLNSPLAKEDKLQTAISLVAHLSTLIQEVSGNPFKGLNNVTYRLAETEKVINSHQTSQEDVDKFMLYNNEKHLKYKQEQFQNFEYVMSKFAELDKILQDPNLDMDIKLKSLIQNKNELIAMLDNLQPEVSKEFEGCRVDTCSQCIVKSGFKIDIQIQPQPDYMDISAFATKKRNISDIIAEQKNNKKANFKDL